MDHWGDPWADDADADTHAHTTIATPAKVAAEPQLPRCAALTPTFKPAPIVVNGFLDDAGWGSNAWATTPSPRKDKEEDFGGEQAGRKLSWAAHEAQEGEESVGESNEDEGFSAWATAPGIEGDVEEGPGVNGVDHAAGWDASSLHDGYARRDSIQNEPGNEWSRIEEVVEGTKDGENGVSESSESATTIHADDAPVRTENGGTVETPREDDASTRSSESHSDGSRNGAVTESPRTSVEEERAAVKSAEATREDGEGLEGHITEHHERPELEVEDDFGEFEDEVAQEAADAQLDVEPTHDQPESLSTKSEEEMASELLPTGHASSFALDSKLLAELFPPVKDTPQVEEPPADPVSSTSTRKAWYRLTRKQTMREYNSGALDDNYIRVTWKTSHIKSEAVKTVARWANEDRIAGRGPGARASFFWDTPHSPTDKRASFASLHSRKASAASVSKPVRPVSQTVQSLSTDVPAAFNWSSPSSATHAVPDNLGMRATSSPITAKHTAITKLQKQSGRAASVDLGARPRAPASHRRTSTTTELHNGPPPAASRSSITPIEALPRASFDSWGSTITSSPVAPIPAPNSDPWASLGALDTSSPPKPSSAAPDDDDEWGEMVESPAVSTVQTPISTVVHTPIAEFPERPTQGNTVSTTSTTPVSANSSQSHSISPPTGPVHASPIVRLQGTVSPTSALFGPKALVPTDTEERIGPHLLKKRDRSREATPERATAVPVQLPTMDEVLGQPPAKKDLKEEEADNERFIATTPTPPPQPSPEAPISRGSESMIPQPAPTATLPPPVDEPNWGDDADFSIFESAPPLSASASAPPPFPHSDPADPWSIFDSPTPAEPSTPFTRPGPRPVTPPAKQPLTSATSSAQRRKVEEDDVVSGIVEGLPDLGYMLRR